MESVEQLIARSENPWVSDVREFIQAKLPYVHLPQYPTLPSPDQLLENIASLHEECSELSGAAAQRNMTEIADALADVIYVAVGMALRCGIPLTAVFADVQRSNMDKRPAVAGTKGRRAAGGLSMKPEGWIGPRIVEIFEAQP